MNLAQLVQSIEQRRQAPTERWNPPYCGELPIHIDAKGRWLYQGSEIKRLPLIQLFASVLVKEQDDYFLITPAEKVKITVADAPFMITAWEQLDHEGIPIIQVTSNVEDSFAISAQHPLLMKNGEPYVDCGSGLLAKVHRNVFYQWSELAQSEDNNGEETWYLHSAGEKFPLS